MRWCAEVIDFSFFVHLEKSVDGSPVDAGTHCVRIFIFILIEFSHTYVHRRHNDMPRSCAASKAAPISFR